MLPWMLSSIRAMLLIRIVGAESIRQQIVHNTSDVQWRSAKVRPGGTADGEKDMI